MYHALRHVRKQHCPHSKSVVADEGEFWTKEYKSELASVPIGTFPQHDSELQKKLDICPLEST